MMATGSVGQAAMWRHFAFYDLASLRDQSTAKAPIYVSEAVATAFATDGESVFVSNAQGTVRQIELGGLEHEGHFTVLRAFEVFAGSSHDGEGERRREGSVHGMMCRRVADRDVLLAVGEQAGVGDVFGGPENKGKESESNRSGGQVLALWDVTGREIATQLRIEVLRQGLAHPVSAWSAAADISAIAIGFASGVLLLVRNWTALVLEYSREVERRTRVQARESELTYAARRDLALRGGTNAKRGNGSGKFTSSLAQSLPTPRVVYEAPEPITGLGLGLSKAEKVDPDAIQVEGHLFITTTSSTLVMAIMSSSTSNAVSSLPSAFSMTPFTLTQTGVGKVERLDNIGADIGCAGLLTRSFSKQGSRAAAEFVIARDDALYIYGVDGRGPCYALEGQKASMDIIDDAAQVIIFSPLSGGSGAVPGPKTLELGSGLKGISENARCTIFDLDNKCIIHQGSFPNGVRTIASRMRLATHAKKRTQITTMTMSQAVVLVTSFDARSFLLTEKSLATKLAMVYQRGLFALAIAMAHRSSAASADIARIHQRYGDHLVEKGELDGAVEQYCKTIGFVDSKAVVKKFLNIKHIGHLAPYLERLHEKGLAGPEHTTLLLNSYIKIKDEEKLESFVSGQIGQPSTRKSSPNDLIKKGEDEKGLEDREAGFDIQTALSVLRSSGYYTYAAKLAYRFDQMDEYVTILIEDLEDYDESLSYLQTLSPPDAIRNLIKFARNLLNHKQDETVDLLAALCGGRFRTRTRASEIRSKTEVSALPVRANGGRPLDSYSKYISFSMRRPSPHSQSSALQESVDDALYAIQHATVPHYDIPSVSTFFLSFVNFQDALQSFLESVAELRWGNALVVDSALAPKELYQIDSKEEEEQNEQEDGITREKRCIWDTLIELYLRDDGESDQVGNWKKTLAVLKTDEIPYDADRAQFQCLISRFLPGTIRLLEKRGRYHDIMQLCMTASKEVVQVHEDLLDIVLASPVVKSTSNLALKALHRYGDREPLLYVDMLRFVVSSASALDEIGNDALFQIIDRIDETSLLSTLEIVKELGKNRAISVGMVRGWLIDRLNRDEDEREANVALAQSYRDENAKLKARLDKFMDTKRPTFSKDDKCSSCGLGLEVPVVHFLCGHSYHQRCLPDQIQECPLDSDGLALLRSPAETQKLVSEQQDPFYYHLEHAQDGMAAIVEHGFGKGLLSRLNNLNLEPSR